MIKSEKKKKNVKQLEMKKNRTKMIYTEITTIDSTPVRNLRNRRKKCGNEQNGHRICF